MSDGRIEVDDWNALKCSGGACKEPVRYVWAPKMHVLAQFQASCVFHQRAVEAAAKTMWKDVGVHVAIRPRSS